jgi:hypothetical protein
VYGFEVTLRSNSIEIRGGTATAAEIQAYSPITAVIDRQPPLRVPIRRNLLTERRLQGEV